MYCTAACDELGLCLLYLVLFFFFKQKTAYDMRISDWSSDVCSSDLSRTRLRPEACSNSAGRVEARASQDWSETSPHMETIREERHAPRLSSDRKSVV